MKYVQMGDFDTPAYLFRQGSNFESYRFFGAHPVVKDGEKGVIFRVWAPHAKAVSLVGEFNGWDTAADPMKNVNGSGIWECFSTRTKEFDIYKYNVVQAGGKSVMKTDPYAFHTETRPGNGGKIYDLAGYRWGDGAWMKARPQINHYASPMNVYELHAGSWQIYPNGKPFNYKELAEHVIPYVEKMGYTHIELMPMTEYPFDGSWGYQVGSYYAPTSRYGTPRDFKHFIDACHQHGIGVLMDWVPAHFPKDEFGLYMFDGTDCYEDTNPYRREHKGWGTMVFNFGKPEIQSFLVSDAMFWLNEYHIDGLRVDAVASMLYLNYCRPDGEWMPNNKGGVENLEAVAFLQKLNAAVRDRVPGAITVAEESTSWAGVTAPPEKGGLGFTFKWNMGWMNDFLRYVALDPVYRKFEHEKLTFSMMYAFSEHYVLPLSHDEVVHGKLSLLNKMPGSYDQKFDQLRAFTGYMMAHPGKKLLFMGGEFGQFIEWDEKKGLDWFLLDYDRHRQMQAFSAKLNHFYKDTPALWQDDDSWAGFQWIIPDDRDNSVLAFRRIDKSGNEVIAVFNFTPVKRENYSFGVPRSGWYKVLLNSDDPEWGGHGDTIPTTHSHRVPMHGLENSLTVNLPALSCVYFRVPDERKKAAPKASGHKPAEK